MRIKLLIAIVLATAALVGATGYLSRLCGFERHSGLFAPVWNENGETLYVLRRTTGGFVWGFGWEFFTPPAFSYVTSDSFALLRVSQPNHGAEVLVKWSGSPLVGRITRHYRGRIFNYLSARLEPSQEGLRVQLQLSIPRIPSSEVWGLDTMWRPGQGLRAKWTEGGAAGLARPEAVLMWGREVLTVPGRESFGAAVLVVDKDGGYSVALKDRSFDALYPDGVPPKGIADRSQRRQIERVREFRSVTDELVGRIMASEGVTEGQAILRAYDDMERRGYLPRHPRIIATQLSEPPPDLPVFDIPVLYLEVGLFHDIAEAIRSPGTVVKSGIGTYLSYDGDDLGPRLKSFREAGGDRFVVQIENRSYLIERAPH